MDIKIKKHIAKKAITFLAENKLTQVVLADKCGVPKEYFSQIVKEDTDFIINAGGGKTVTIADKYFKRIADFLGLPLTNTYWQIKATSQLTTALAILQDSKQYGTTSLIIGETGSGKTQTVDLFHKRNPVDTFVITVGSTDNLSDLIDKVISKLKITSGKSKSSRLRAIATKLRNMREDGFNPQLIFDEAEYMKAPALCSMKEMHDSVSEFASLVMIGTDQLIVNLDKLRRRNKAGIPQFYRRIKFGIRHLPSVDRTFKIFIEDESKEVQKFLQSICDNYGEIHDVLVPVRRESERTDQPVTVDFIKKVLNLPNNYAA